MSYMQKVCPELFLKKDQLVVRDGVTCRLAMDEDMEVIGMAHCGAQYTLNPMIESEEMYVCDLDLTGPVTCLRCLGNEVPHGQ